MDDISMSTVAAVAPRLPGETKMQLHALVGIEVITFVPSNASPSYILTVTELDLPPVQKSVYERPPPKLMKSTRPNGLMGGDVNPKVTTSFSPG
jgi:hypothetical protein